MFALQTVPAYFGVLSQSGEEGERMVYRLPQ